MEIEGETYLTTAELANYFAEIGFKKGANQSTLSTWRSSRSAINGPKYIKFGGTVYYPEGEVKSFLLDLRSSIQE